MRSGSGVVGMHVFFVFFSYATSARCSQCAKDSHVPPPVPPPQPVHTVLCQLDTTICVFAWQHLPTSHFTFSHDSHSFVLEPSRECVKMLESEKSPEDACE